MGFEFNNDAPLYLQMAEQIKAQIIANEYSLGAKLPSVRDLSMEHRVNPNTVQKALFELESQGLITTERTNGKFVTKDQSIIDRVKKQIVKSKVDEFFWAMQGLGYDKEQIINIVKNKE